MGHELGLRSCAAFVPRPPYGHGGLDMLRRWGPVVRGGRLVREEFMVALKREERVSGEGRVYCVW